MLLEVQDTCRIVVSKSFMMTCVQFLNWGRGGWKGEEVTVKVAVQEFENS